MPYAYPEAVLEQLWRPGLARWGQSIYAVLDAARDERIYPALVASDAEHYCLFRGELDAGVAEAAPYLVELHRDAPFTNWLITYGWGDSWGIFCESRATHHA